jgi:hypothetical protein
MNISQSLLWKFRYLEWTFIAIHFLIRASEANSDIRLSLIFYTIFVLLSWIYPNNRSYWQKLGYICLGILLAITASLQGISLDLLIYLYIGKSVY